MLNGEDGSIIAQSMTFEMELYSKQTSLSQKLAQMPQWKRDEMAQWSTCRRFVDKVLTYTEWLVGIVVLANLACIARETDLNVSGVETLPFWLRTANRAFILFYVTELV